jgi:hypothetical protein
LLDRPYRYGGDSEPRMDIEKVFRPGKWFVGFCAVLVVVWLAYQAVASARLGEEAKLVGQQIFDWSLHSDDSVWDSKAEMTDAKVLKKTDTMAIVEVRGKQNISEHPVDKSKPVAEDKGECGATLTFYKRSKNWVLGKVELQ